MDIGKRIAYLRKLQGLSTHALANQSGISHSYLKSVEEGKSNITVIKLEEICDSLGISLSDFFTEELDIQKDLNKKMQLLKIVNALTESQTNALLSFLESLTK